MKKVKCFSLALLCTLTFSLIISNGQTFTISPVNSGGVTITPDGEEVTIENDLMKMVLWTKGARAKVWTIKGPPELELAADVGASGPDYRYPLWDWIPAQEPKGDGRPGWPGELWTGTYSFEIKAEENKVIFTHTCTSSPIGGLEVTKIFTFSADKYYFNLTVILSNPTGSDIRTQAGWTADPIGYGLNAIVFGPSLRQAYQYGNTPMIDQSELGITTIMLDNVKWVAVYSKETNEIMAIAADPNNITAGMSVELEGGSWGIEARLSFPSVTIGPGKQVTYPMKVYGGLPDFLQLSEIDMANLATGLAFSVDLESDKFVYSKDDTCKYVLNMTNNLGTSLSDIDINLTLWTSSETAALRNKIRDVYPERGIEVGGKSSVVRQGDVKLNVTDDIYCLYLQVYGKGTLMTSTVLLIPVITELPAGWKPLTVCFVWNLYQPFFVDPQGRFWKGLAQEYVDKGNKPYLWHMLTLENHTSINVTFNLQPTLLYQWSASKDARWTVYEFVDRWVWVEYPKSEGAKAALEGYADLAATGQIELLASPYYHPIMPILVAKDWTSDVIDQLEMSKAYIQTLMGVNPTGAWIPEMAFNMSLVPIINETGLQYTVLDIHMLEQVVSPLPHQKYQPWYVMNPQSNKSLVAFFRDDILSDKVANVWNTHPRHSQAAREFIAYLYLRILSSRPLRGYDKVVTIALDEWISTGGPVAHLTLDDFYSAIEQCPSWLKTATLKQALKLLQPAETVDNLYEGSWINATALNEWNMTIINPLWNQTEVSREIVMEYAESLSAEKRFAYNTTDSKLKKALECIYVAETSDWYKIGAALQAGDANIAEKQVTAYAELAEDTISPKPPNIWPFVLGGGFVAVIVALIAVGVYRKRKGKVSSPKPSIG